MDPNANLMEQEAELSLRRDERDMDRLDYLRETLSEWLASGGFAPDWSKAPRAAQYYGK